MKGKIRHVWNSNFRIRLLFGSGLDWMNRKNKFCCQQMQDQPLLLFVMFLTLLLVIASWNTEFPSLLKSVHQERNNFKASGWEIFVKSEYSIFLYRITSPFGFRHNVLECLVFVNISIWNINSAVLWKRFNFTQRFKNQRPENIYIFILSWKSIATSEMPPCLV